MCLTGVDYFSTLGYQPGIAFLAAGALAPVATAILILVTLFGALPMYIKVANDSPHGEGSIQMLRGLLPRWQGKTFILALLGFAATSWIITITLSAADATAHIIENPFVPHWMDHRVVITLLLLAALGGIFLKGFKEAIWLAVALVIVYLGLNVVVIGRELWALSQRPELLTAWRNNAFLQPLHPLPGSGNLVMMVAFALIVFPKLALGLSGFETGVAVMPLVRGVGGPAADPAIELRARIENTRKLLRVAALIMSVLLIGSSLITATMIPAHELHSGGEASGRAIAYLAHRDFGEIFGTLYDISTISILWFAGASAMAGCVRLNVPALPQQRSPSAIGTSVTPGIVDKRSRGC